MDESDSLYVGRPGDLWIGRDGSLFVADAFGKRVIRFDRQGAPRRSYGEQGSGPGQFESVRTVFGFDSIIAAADPNDSRLELFHRSTGEFLGARRYDGILGSVDADDTRLLAGNLNLPKNSSLLIWRRDRSDLEYAVPLPELYRRSPPLRGIYNGISVAAWGDTVVLGYMGLQTLRVLDASLNTIGTVRVPAVRRRGHPDDMIRDMERLPFPEKFSLVSALFAISRLPDGELALVHYDQEILESRRVLADVYISLLSPDLTRACVDRLVPTTDVAQPRVAFRGDSIFVLQQEVDENSQRANTFVTIHEISSDGCDWRAVRLSDDTNLDR